MRRKRIYLITQSLVIVFSGLLVIIYADINPGISGYDSDMNNATNETDLNTSGNPEGYSIALPVHQFAKVDKLSGERDYYKVMSDDSGLEYIHSHYVPSTKVVRYGYKLPDTMRNVTQVSWLWRVVTPPEDADERNKGLNDSGCAVYLIFKDNVKTYCIKYVYSSAVPQGTIIRKDPVLYPIQQMYMVVANTWSANDKGQWKKVVIDVCSDFKRIYKVTKCPELKGIGILSDGDGTKSEVVADYAAFKISGEN